MEDLHDFGLPICDWAEVRSSEEATDGNEEKKKDGGFGEGWASVSEGVSR
jgi:hypothetical protein